MSPLTSKAITATCQVYDNLNTDIPRWHGKILSSRPEYKDKGYVNTASTLRESLSGGGHLDSQKRRSLIRSVETVFRNNELDMSSYTVWVYDNKPTNRIFAFNIDDLVGIVITPSGTKRPPAVGICSIKKSRSTNHMSNYFYQMSWNETGNCSGTSTVGSAIIEVKSQRSKSIEVTVDDVMDLISKLPIDKGLDILSEALERIRPPADMYRYEILYDEMGYGPEDEI